MADVLSPVEWGVIQDLLRQSQVMVQAVAQTGSGLFTQEVEDFQKLWNNAPDTVNKAIRVFQSGGSWFHLVEDGQYGPNTSRALFYTIGYPKPPRRASGMPQYYAANAAVIDSLIAPDHVDAQAMLDSAQAVPPSPTGAYQEEAARAVDQATTSGALAQSITPAEGTPLPPGSFPPDYGSQPVAVPVGPEPPGVNIDTASLAAQADAMQAESEGMAPVFQELEFAADVPVVATRVPRDYPFVAIGVGVVALGGVLWAMTRGTRRR